MADLVGESQSARKKLVMNPAQPTSDVSDAKPPVPFAPLPMAALIPDNPTEDQVKAILATLDEMAVLGDSSDIIVKRTPRQPQDAAERLLLAVFGYAENEWTFLPPLNPSREW